MKILKRSIEYIPLAYNTWENRMISKVYLMEFVSSKPILLNEEC